MFRDRSQNNVTQSFNRGAGSSSSAGDLLQASLWKLKSGMIGNSWKRKWISTDGFILSQWASEGLPKKAIPARHTYSLQRCSITEEPGLRPYAFKLSDRKTGESVVLACDNMADYLAWYNFITTPREGSKETFENKSADFPPGFSEALRRGSRRGSETLAHESQALSAPSGPEPIVAAAVIKRMFAERSPDANIGFFIRDKDFWDIMKEAGGHIENSVAERGLDALKKKTGYISYEDFVQWWNLVHSKKPSRGSVQKIAESLQHVAAAEGAAIGAPLNADTDSVLSSSIYSDTKPSKISFAGMKGIFSGDNVHLVGIIDSEIMSIEDTALICKENSFSKNKLPSVNAVLNEWSVAGCADWNNRFQQTIEAALEAQVQVRWGSAPISADPVEQRDSSTVLGSYFAYFSVYGNFLAAASKGARVVIDDYPLPSHLRKSQSLRLRENEGVDSTGGAIDDDMFTEELFFYDGLVFRLISTPLTSRDLDANYNESYIRQVHLANEIKHKMIGNEFRAYNALQNAIYALQSEAVDQNKSSQYPGAMLQTVLDYGGYRLHVFCPVSVSEATLRYGFTEHDGTFKHFQHDEALSDPYHDVCASIAKKLNIAEQNKEVLSHFFTADEMKPPILQHASEILLGDDVQIHIAEDNRQYFVNFGKILPPDLPRTDSNDVLTRCLRPEFVRKYRVPLSRKALFEEVEESLDGGPTEAMRPAQVLLDACIELRTSVLLRVTRQIDLLVVCPADSFCFTQFIHSQGVNCRYLGAMYALSTSFHTRQLLLCEAISRTVKILLRQAMHHVNRKGRAESLLAEERGKSRDENFLDHQRNVIKARNEAIVDIFNLVLGRGTRSEEFWNGVLSDAVKSKFNLTMPSFLASSAMLSSVQLFHALGYHCGVSFSSDKDYDFSVHDPFKYEDLSSYRPKVKSSTSYPGSQHSPIAVAAAMMQERMFQDALSLLRIHTSSLMIMNSGNDTLEFVSPMLSYQHLYSGYLMGLCLFYVKNYESSIALLQSYKDMAPKKSLMEARLITLLMAAQFKYKNSASDSVKVSLDSFEKGSVVYSEALGLKHPYHGLHVNALADLYFLVQALPQAKATLMIAFELFQAALGHMHPVCAGVLTKIGILLMMQGQVTPAIETFSSALLVYEEINKICSEEGSADATKTVYVDDQSHCMHALAAALNIKGDTKAATSTAFKAIDIVTTAGRMITPAITHNLLLLAELLELGGDYSAAVTLYQDVWDVVKQSPKSYHMSAMLVDLASRLIHATIDSLPLTSRVLLETIRADREAVDGKTWSSIISTVCDEFWNEEPCTYVAKIISQGLEIASTGEIFSLSSRLGKASKGVVGVPFGGKPDAASSSKTSDDDAELQSDKARFRTQTYDEAARDASHKDAFLRGFSANSRVARPRSQLDAQLPSRSSDVDHDAAEGSSKEAVENVDENIALLMKLKVILRLGMKNTETISKGNADERR